MTTINFSGAGESRTDEGVAAAARKIGCEVEALEAVMAVETRGKGYDSQGRVRCLFEPHRFYALLPPAKRATAVKQGLAYAKWKPGAYPKDSYPRIQKAMAIDQELALQATSWGLGQIMGSNFKACGYRSARAMVEAFARSEDEQIMGMANFIVASGALARALKAKRWADFAKGYNGPGYAENRYDVKLAAAYKHLKGSALPAKTVEDSGARGLLSDPGADDQTEGDDAPAVDPDKDSTSGSDGVDEEFDNPPTVPDPVVPPPMPRAKLQMLQTQLQKLNYSMVGKADGAYGASTVAAVAAFQHDHEMPVTGKIDDETEAAILNEETPRDIPEARAAASVKEVAERVPSVKQNWISKILAGIGAFFASVWTFLEGVIDKIPGAQSMFGNVKGFLGDIPPWTYGLAIAGLAAGIFWFSHLSEKEAVKDFRTGRTS